MRDRLWTADVCGLIAACVDDPGVAPVLADRLSEGGIEAPGLRRQCTLPDLIELCRVIPGALRSRALACLRSLDGWVSLLRAPRIMRAPVPVGPELESVRRGYERPTLREAEGSEQYRAYVVAWGPGRRRWYLCSGAHLRRLCLRVLSGLDVPPDVQRDSAHYAAHFRGLLRGVAPAHPSEEGDEGFVNLGGNNGS
jgi:hypothetical protein